MDVRIQMGNGMIHLEIKRTTVALRMRFLGMLLAPTSGQVLFQQKRTHERCKRNVNGLDASTVRFFELQSPISFLVSVCYAKRIKTDRSTITTLYRLKSMENVSRVNSSSFSVINEKKIKIMDKWMKSEAKSRLFFFNLQCDWENTTLFAVAHITSEFLLAVQIRTEKRPLKACSSLRSFPWGSSS